LWVGAAGQTGGKFRHSRIQIIDHKPVVMNADSQLSLAAIVSMRPGDRRRHRSLLQKSQIKKRIDHHARAAGEDFAFLDAKILLVEIALYFRLCRNERDMS
jgi:hypothetical protein